MTFGNNKGQHFEWDILVPHIIHPTKVAIIEAMGWIDEPVSPRDLHRSFAEELELPLVAYHVRGLAEIGAVRKVRERAVRGVLQTFYVLRAKEPAETPPSYE